MPGDLAETYTFPAAPASQSEMEKDLTPPTEEAQNKVEGEPIAGSQQVLNLEKAASESEEGKSEEELPELYQKDTPKASLVESVREFVQRLEQWKHLLPTSLSEDAAALKSHTDDMRLLEEPVPHPPKSTLPEWNLAVKRCSMEEWVTRCFFAQPPGLGTPQPYGVAMITPPPPPPPPPLPPGSMFPAHVIEAYYRTKYPPLVGGLPQASATSRKIGRSNAAGTAAPINDSKEIQRIMVNSGALRQELEEITGVTLGTVGVTIAPPYKLILPFIEDFKVRLDELEEALGKLRSRKKGDDSEKHKHQIRDTAKTAKNNGDASSNREDDDAEFKMAETDELESSAPGSSIAIDFDDVDIIQDDLTMRHSHLKCFYDFAREELKDLLDLRASIANGTCKKILFEDLWHLFKPGDVIYGVYNGRVQLNKVYACSGGQLRRKAPPEDYNLGYTPGARREDTNLGSWTTFKVDAFDVQYNGREYGPRAGTHVIHYYAGERDITELPMYPIRFQPGGEGILREMEERGKRYIASSGHRWYEGTSLSLDPSHGLREEIESDIYVDFETYYQLRPQEALNFTLSRNQYELSESNEEFRGASFLLCGQEVDGIFADEFANDNRDLLKPMVEAELNKHPELICLLVDHVAAYVFRSRDWHWLNIDLVKEIDDDSRKAPGNGFEDLVIPSAHRRLLIGLVENHASAVQRKAQKRKNAVSKSTMAQIDLVRGKGLGLIILLHGPPGSGKTSTAETIATYTKRPLYAITCGDLGVTPQSVEVALKQHTRQADKWGCVLLLDEADVFLMQRSWQDIDRNALVSVFLRELEYYSGILFLTTNRPGVIDEAFKSRIHISLRYQPIDSDATQTMWKNIMNRLEGDNATAAIKIEFDRDELLEFAKSHFKRHERHRTTWNGRQIRNGFQTALALAHYDRIKKLSKDGITPDQAAESGKKKWMKVKLTKKHFSDIARTANDFENYLAGLRGQDATNAVDEGLRDDYNDPSAGYARKQYDYMSSSKKGSSPSRSTGIQSRSKGRKPASEISDSEGEDSSNGDYDDDDDDDESDNDD